MLDIVELIKKDASKNLETILKYIANLFGADDAIFTHCKNIICKNKYIENMCKQTVTIEYCDSDNIFPEISEKNNIKSLMATPVFLEGKPFSILQLHYKKYHRHFHRKEIILFEKIASMLFPPMLVLSEIEEKFIGSSVLMMEVRDIYTKGHSQRVAIYSKKLPNQLV